MGKKELNSLRRLFWGSLVSKVGYPMQCSRKRSPASSQEHAWRLCGLIFSASRCETVTMLSKKEAGSITLTGDVSRYCVYPKTLLVICSNSCHPSCAPRARLPANSSLIPNFFLLIDLNL